ncbi:MAG: cupin domain-containing protein [Ilumatobacteraceae bacterium]
MAFRPLHTASELHAPVGGTDFDPTAEIGEEIRGLRKANGLTLKEVAAGAGISVGYLSEIERNLTRLPIGVLKAICDVFGIHMNWFFRTGKSHGPAEERDIVVRATNRPTLSFTGLGITEELLSPNLTGSLEMLISTIAPSADSGAYSHDGAEAGVVLEGTLELWIDDTHLHLEAGDSFAFASTRQHRCANPTSTPTKVLWVITPPHY